MNDAIGTKQVLEVLLVVAAGVGGFGVLVMLLMRGAWSKMGEPAVKELFKAWQNAPESIAAQETFVKRVIDNEIRRDDGLIYKEIKAKTESSSEKLLEAFDELKQKLDEKQESQLEFERDVGKRLATIEGFLRVSNKRATSAESDPKFQPPAVYPKPR